MPARPARRGRRKARVQLALAAFAPAFALMTWRTWETIFAWPFGIMTILGVGVTFGVLIGIRTGNFEPFTFTEITDSSGDIIGHVGMYLAVAVSNPTASIEEAVIVAIILSLIFLIHVSVGLVHVNPMFYVLGYRVYTGVTDLGNTYYLIARSEVADWHGPQNLSNVSGILMERTGDARFRSSRRGT